jgi:hypothetical protein
MECFDTSMPSYSNATRTMCFSAKLMLTVANLARPFLLRNEGRGLQQVRILSALGLNILQAAYLGMETEFRAQPDLVRSYS